jgi:hypothetical protein
MSLDLLNESSIKIEILKSDSFGIFLSFNKWNPMKKNQLDALILNRCQIT